MEKSLAVREWPVVPEQVGSNREVMGRQLALENRSCLGLIQRVNLNQVTVPVKDRESILDSENSPFELVPDLPSTSDREPGSKLYKWVTVVPVLLRPTEYYLSVPAYHQRVGLNL